MAGEAGGHLFAVLWGVGATAFGWVVATDFRGAARRAHRGMVRSTPWSRRQRTPAASEGMVRAIAGVFALAGPVAVVVGVRGLLRGETGVRRLLTRRLLYLPPWFLAAGVVILAVALWLAWRKAGPLRRIWSSGTGPQRGACVAATVAAAGFLALSATGWTMLAVISWLIGMLAVVTLLAAGREERVDEGSPAS